MFRRKVRCLMLVVVAAGLAQAVEWSTVVPPARCAARMVVDTANHRIVVFGGTSVYLDGRYFNDVWEVPLDRPGLYPWRRLTPGGTPPTSRADHVMVYYPAGRRVVVFAGSPGIGSALNDVWSLSLTPGREEWRRLDVSGATPQARCYASAAYYPPRGSLLVFGGYNWGPYYNDVWELSRDGLSWRPLAVSGTPPSARCDAAAALDEASNRLLLFGGRDYSGFCNDLWQLDLTQGSESWTQLFPSGTIPDRRTGFAHAYDPVAGKLCVFGGWNESRYFDDLYVLDVNTLVWSRVNTAGESPVARRNTCGAWDPDGCSFFVFNGEPYRGVYLSELHYVNLGAVGTAEPEWRPAEAAGPVLYIPGVSRGAVRIRYEMPRADHMSLDILDAAGRVVRRLFSGVAAPIGDCVTWDGKHDSGLKVAAGTYYCRLQAGATTVTTKFILAE